MFKYLLTTPEECLATYFILYDLQVFWFQPPQEKNKWKANKGGLYIGNKAQEYFQ